MNNKEDLKALLHYLISFTGGFLGVYPVIYVAKSFASAQTANELSLLLNLTDGNVSAFLLRLLGLTVFCIPIIFLTIHKSSHNRIAAVIVVLVDAVVLAVMPETLSPLIAVLPNFFAMSFMWCCFDGAYGFTAAPIFSTNNTRQFISSLVEVYINKNTDYKIKMKFYGFTLLSFNLGVFVCALLSTVLNRYVSLLAIIPMLSSLYLCFKTNL